MSKDITILLPETIYIMKTQKHQLIAPIAEEYNIYFKNIIQPFNDAWDVLVKCDYGKNLGNCWRLSGFTDDIDSFNFEISVYDEYGQRLASGASKIVMVERVENKRTRVLFLGDSMTHSQIYVNHIVHSLKGIDTIGIRSFDGNVFHEGRGGWSYNRYFNAYTFDFGLSPFLFPKGVAGKDYWGNKEYIDATRNPTSEVYQYYGYSFDDIKTGQYFTCEGKLFKKTDAGDELISDTPEFEFDFAKYLERYNLEAPEILSVLLGANDLQICPYEESDACVAEYINNAKRLISMLKEAVPSMKIIINLPILGAEQHSWGTQLGCVGGEKMYRYNIMRGVKKLIDEFDNKQKENVFLSPMIACIDPIFGFPYAQVKANKYTEKSVKVQNNWVHPSNSGYCQMGDALSAVIEYIRR